MSAQDVAKQLVDLCESGEFQKAVESLYADDIVSIEGPGTPEEQVRMEGIDAIRGKNQWWVDNHEVHSIGVSGPFIGQHDDQFMVQFDLDVTPKSTGERTVMREVGLYTVRDGKVAREEFWYQRD